MRALTVLQPMAGLLACGDPAVDAPHAKPAELRRMAPPGLLEERFAIHAGARQWPLADAARAILGDIVLPLKWTHLLTARQAVIATARVDRFEPVTGGTASSRQLLSVQLDDHQARRALPLVHRVAARTAWVLRDVVALPTPVGCRGALGLWTLDAQTAHRVRALEAAAADGRGLRGVVAPVEPPRVEPEPAAPAVHVVTLGYRGRIWPEFTGELHARGVETVVDIRHWPHVPNPRWNRSGLSEGLREAGLRYWWAGDIVGNPPWIRGNRGDRLTDGQVREMLAEYGAHIGRPGIVAQFVRELLRKPAPYALLCACEETPRCHRSVLLDAVLLELKRLGRTMTTFDLQPPRDDRRAQQELFG